MANTSDIRNGLCIRYNRDIFKIIEFLHIKVVKSCFCANKAPKCNYGKVIDNTFAGHKIEDVRVETHKFQYLYPEGDIFHFMNVEDYNPITLSKTAIDNPGLLKEGEVVIVIINEDDMPLSVEMPASVILEVTATEPGLKEIRLPTLQNLLRLKQVPL